MRPRAHILFALLSALSCAPLPHVVLAQAFPPGFVHPQPIPEPPPYDGPLRPNEAAPGWYAVRSSAWEVTPDVVERMRALIGQKARRPLDNYRIGYRGVVQYRHRIVLVSGYCRTMFMTERDLVEQPVVVADGPACFFDGWYDADEQRVTHFYFHDHS
ncbi:hypothetical protein [Massilia sp. 9096]|uniref:hypothetical protein n=1 Tax=Massilia sp. 9096 TaxID=1500894 RepID=UPI00055CBECE|nr:hypothetical protein [Massilia sp. 9096]